MKKILTITFHASYNYGSCLQAYALQEYVKKLENYECDYKIINLRTDIQKQMYKNCYEKNDFRSNIKKILFLKEKKAILIKKDKFEKFLKDYLSLTQEYSSLEKIKKDNIKSDYYLAGSDQLWNLQANDFDWANYLEFVNNGKKISYAASFGPKVQQWNEEEKKRIKRDLQKFDMLSVREQGSFNNVKELIGNEPEINVDPTMLLDKEEWEKIIDNKKVYKEGEYIFLYNLKDKDYVKLAQKISKELGLPIVVSMYGNKLELIYGFKKEYACGPLEFLNLIKNAKLVLSSSFHGTIFSIIFNKPFFALNGNNDLRINTLLKKMDLQERSIELENYKEKCKNAFEINFEQSKKLLKNEQEKSKEYLKRALDIE